MSERFDRRAALGFIGGAGLSVVAGCSARSGETETGPEETQTTATSDTRTASSRRQLRLYTSGTPSFDPVRIQESKLENPIVFEPLYRYRNGTLPVEPNLVRDHEVSADGITHRVGLKRGVEFHDGSELTAADVVYTWRRLVESEHSQVPNFLTKRRRIDHEVDSEGNYVEGSLAVRAPQQYTVEFDVKRPFEGIRNVLADPLTAIVPEGIVGDIAGYDGKMSHREFATDEPIGTGPFSLESWEPGSKVVVSSFDDYHGGSPPVSGIHFDVVSGTEARDSLAINKNVDQFSLGTSRFDPGKVSIDAEDNQGRRVGTYGPLTNGEVVNYGEVTRLAVDFYFFNLRRVPERPVRQAIAYALNQHRLVESKFKSLGQPAYHMTPPQIFEGGVRGYDRHARSEYPYGYDETKIEAAREVMEEAGYGQSERYQIELTIISNSSAWEKAATLLRDKLASAYIDMRISEAEFPIIINQAIDQKLDMFTFSSGLDRPHPASILQYLHPSTTSPVVHNWGKSDTGSTAAAQEAESAWSRFTDRSRGYESEYTDEFTTMEEANWADVVELPVMHPIEQSYWYDWTDVEMVGPMNTQSYADVSVESRKNSRSGVGHSKT